MAQEANANECPQAIKDAISKIPLTDIDDNELKPTEIRLLEEERVKIYKEKIEALQDETKVKYVVSVECVPKDEEDDIKIEDKTVYEKIFSVDDKMQQFNEVEIEDMIMYDEISPSQSVEYTFYENGPWFLAGIGQDSMESYKGSKFKVWKKQIEEPVCEAAFKRLLCIGLITTLFDRFCFKIPESEKADYIVKDDHGKDVELPRPVKRLRIWDVKTRKYKELDPTLGGAPSKDEADKYWEDMLNKFRETRGIDYINGLLDSFNKKE